MFRETHYWFEDHEVLGTLIKLMVGAVIIGLVLGFVGGGIAALIGYPELLKSFVCWALCICASLGAILCAAFGLYAIVVPKM